MPLFKILVADDEESMRWVLSKALCRKGFTVEQACDGDEALRMLSAESFDLAIIDIKMPGLSSLELLDKIRALKSDLLVVIMSAESGMRNAVESMKRGAYDYITKPFDLDVIDSLVEKVRHAKEMADQFPILKQKLNERLPVENYIIGNSPAMQKLYKIIGKVAETDLAVLIQGELGSGEEYIARAIHSNSKRSNEHFVGINCAVTPRSFLERELFGIEKENCNALNEEKRGKFEQANYGTIFLENISEMPLDLQAKILCFLQDQKINKVGGNQNASVNVRIVAATNQDLLEKVRLKEFREDLYYFLNIVPIYLAPLRERREDIPLLVQHYLWQVSKELDTPTKLCTDEAMEILTRYSWPGNLRELENIIIKSVLLSSDQILSDIDFADLKSTSGSSQDTSLESIVENKLRSSLDGVEQLEVGDIYSMVLEQVERPLIRIILEKTRWNQVRAADVLGINRNLLRKRMQELNIELIRN